MVLPGLCCSSWGALELGSPLQFHPICLPIPADLLNSPISLAAPAFDCEILLHLFSIFSSLAGTALILAILSYTMTSCSCCFPPGWWSMLPRPVESQMTHFCWGQTGAKWGECHFMFSHISPLHGVTHMVCILPCSSKAL